MICAKEFQTKIQTYVARTAYTKGTGALRRELRHMRVLEERRTGQAAQDLVVRLLGDTFHLFDRRVHQVVRVRTHLQDDSIYCSILHAVPYYLIYTFHILSYILYSFYRI